MIKKISVISLLVLSAIFATRAVLTENNLAVPTYAASTNSCTVLCPSKSANFGNINTKTQTSSYLKGTFSTNSPVGKFLYSGSSTVYNWCNRSDINYMTFGLGGKLTSIVVTYAFTAEKGLGSIPSDNRYDNTIEVLGKSGSNYVSICSVALSPKGIKITGGLVDNKNVTTADKTKTISQTTYTKLNAYKEYKISCNSAEVSGNTIFVYYNIKLNWTCA